MKGYPKYTLSDNSSKWHDELQPASKDDLVNLPLLKTPDPVKRKPKKNLPPPRRSSRLRSKRVDYSKYY